ncbi:hypothetical protein H4R34_006046, partial [Dimargaris verticillata]
MLRYPVMGNVGTTPANSCHSDRDPGGGVNQDAVSKEPMAPALGIRLFLATLGPAGDATAPNASATRYKL